MNTERQTLETELAELNDSISHRATALAMADGPAYYDALHGHEGQALARLRQRRVEVQRRLDQLEKEHA